METTEFKVPIPEGMEIDKKNSTFECIKFKPIKPKRWRDNEKAKINGYIITLYSKIGGPAVFPNTDNNHNLFATEKQAKSALAMARISQIMANDKRFGGIITDNQWKNPDSYKYCIERSSNRIFSDWHNVDYHFLAFNTEEQRNLFLKENEDLVKDYLMIE